MKPNENWIENVNTNIKNPAAYPDLSQTYSVPYPTYHGASYNDTGGAYFYGNTQQNPQINFAPMNNTMLPTYNHPQNNIIQSYPYNSISHNNNVLNHKLFSQPSTTYQIDSGIGLDPSQGKSPMSGFSTPVYSLQNSNGNSTFRGQTERHIHHSINVASGGSYIDGNAYSTPQLQVNKPIIAPGVTPMIEARYEHRPVAPTKAREAVNKVLTDARVKENTADLRRRELFQKQDSRSFGIR